MKIPASGKIYSTNEGNSPNWLLPMKTYVESVKAKSYSARYVGSMVADVHRTILYGGIFAYPADKKSPKGKLRLIYECFPMAFILEQAGGMAVTGANRTLDIQPGSIHERSAIVLGSPNDVKEYISFEQNNPN
jgi:fructose-1,6-bisphosphatase I